MPNYSVIQPIADTVDRRGQNYNMGVGDANTSSFGAAVEGFSSGMSTALDWSGEIKRQQAEYAPEKLFEEQVQRELKSRELKVAVEQAEIELPYAERKIEADLAATEASTRLTGEQARSYDIKSDIAEQYGMEKERLSLDKTRADIAATRADTVLDTYKTLFGSKKDQAEIAKTGRFLLAQEKQELATIKAKKDQLEATLPGKYGNVKFMVDKALSLPVEQRTEQDNKWLKYEDTVNQYEALQKEYLDRNNHYRQQQERLQSQVLGQRGEPGETTQESLAQSKAAEYEQTMRQSLLNASQAGAEMEGEAGTYLAKRTADDASRQLATLKASDEFYNDAIEATEDDQNIGAIEKTKSLAQLLIAATDLPEGTPQEVVRGKVADVVDRSGGVKNMLEYGQNIEDEDQRAEWDKTVISAAVMAGKQDELLPIQQDILTAGLDEEAAADPKGTKKQISLALANKIHEVTDNDIKALNFNRLVRLASSASDSGRDGFTIAPALGEGDNGQGKVTADVYRVTNTKTGQTQELSKEAVEGDPNSPDAAKRMSQVSAVMSILSEIGAENTQAAKNNVDTNHSLEAAGETYEAGQPDPRIQKQRQQQGAPQPEPAGPPPVDDNGMIEGAAVPIENYTYVTPAQVGSVGMNRDLSAKIGLAGVPKQLKPQFDKFFTRLKGMSLDGIMDTRSNRQLTEDVVDYEWSKLSKTDKDYWANIAQQETLKETQAGILRASYTPKTVFDKYMAAEIGVTIDMYANQVHSKMSLYDTKIKNDARRVVEQQKAAIKEKLIQPGISALDRAEYKRQLEELG